MAVPPEKNVAAVFIGALLFGLYLATFFHCLRWLIYADEGWKLRKKINWTMLFVTVSLFGLSATNHALELHNTMTQVTEHGAPQPANGAGTTAALPWVAVVICTNANLSALIADAVLIYRCWLIYERSRRVVVFPLILWVGGIVCTALQAYWQIVQSAVILHAWQPVNTTIGPGTILTPFWGSTVVLNAYATSMIVVRIWRVSKASGASTSTHQLRFIMRVLIESGFLYLAIAIAHFVVWFTPNGFAISVISTINLPIIGIAFNLILMRAAQRRVDEGLADSATGLKSALRFKVDSAPAGRLTMRTIDIRSASFPDAAEV